MIRRFIPALAAFLAIGACSDAPTTNSDPGKDPSFITFGKPDGNAHSHVGTLLFVQNGVGFFSCSGTLLSPTVMLTAGHCVQGGGKTNDVTYVRFDEDPVGDRGTGPLQEWLNSKWIVAASVVAHPRFNDFADFPDTYDVGLVILSRPVTLPKYGVLPELGLLESLSGRNKLFTAVGYGLQGIIKPFESDIWARYRGDTRLLEVNSTDTGPGHSAKFTSNPGLGGGTCFGDSGGPIFHKTTNVIGAITSFGFTPCIGVDFNFRIDTDIALDFIESYLD